MKHGEQQPSTDISRRTFIEQMGSFLGMLSLPSVLRRGEAPPRHQAPIETEAPHITWNKENILRQFPEFMKFIVDELNHWERRFAGLAMPQPLKELQRALENQVIRTSLERGFSNYGKQVFDLATRIDTISPQSDLYGASISMLGMWWEPFIDLTRILRGVPGAPQWGKEDTQAVLNLARWFEPLTKDPKMERQRPLYIERAKEKTKTNRVLELIANDWDVTHATPEKGETDESNAENKHLFLRMLTIYLDTFPNAMSNINHLYVGNTEDGEQITTRAHYVGKDGKGGMFIEHDIEKAMNLYREYEATMDTDPNDIILDQALRYLDLALLTLTHELGHDFDLDRTPVANIDGVHPADHLRFIDTRLKGLEIMERAFVGRKTNPLERFNALEIQQFLLDPLIPHMYGRDELHDDDDFRAFDDEVQILIDTLDQITQLDTATKKKWETLTGMKSLFTPQKNVPLYIRWFATRGSSEPDDIYDQFTHVSVPTLKYIQSLAHKRQTSATPTSPQERIDRTILLNIKASSMLIVYIYLDRLAQAGEIAPTKQSYLFGTFKNLQLAYLHDKILHTMVGPFGEYTPKDAYFTLRMSVAEQVQHSLEDGVRQRKGRAALLHTQQSPRVGATATAFIENLKETQRSMAKVMGGTNHGDDLLHLYPKLFTRISDVFPKGNEDVPPPATTPGG